MLLCLTVFLIIHFYILKRILFIKVFISDFSCKTCGKFFTTKYTLLKHRMWHHKNEFPPFKFNCNQCAYATDFKSSLVTHKNVHSPDRPHKCSYCGNGFKALSSLNNHVVIHNGEAKMFAKADFFGAPFK